MNRTTAIKALKNIVYGTIALCAFIVLVGENDSLGIMTLMLYKALAMGILYLIGKRYDVFSNSNN